MLGWTLTFVILAIVAAVLGFGGMASGFATIAKVLFFVFLVLFVLALVAGLFQWGRSRHHHPPTG